MSDNTIPLAPGERNRANAIAYLLERAAQDVIGYARVAGIADISGLPESAANVQHYARLLAQQESPQ